MCNNLHNLLNSYASYCHDLEEHRHRTRWNRLYIPSDSLVCDKINDQPHSVFVRSGGSFKLDGEILIIIVAVLIQSFRYFYFKQLHYP
jgi:hypothetical protein